MCLDVFSQIYKNHREMTSLYLVTDISDIPYNYLTKIYIPNISWLFWVVTFATCSIVVS